MSDSCGDAWTVESFPETDGLKIGLLHVDITSPFIGFEESLGSNFRIKACRSSVARSRQ
jgi:hypothetical protein